MRFARCVPTIVALAAAALCGERMHAQQTIPSRSVTIEATTDAGLFRNIGAVRHLPDGRVLVNDPQMRRLIALDRDFKSFTVLADTAPGAPNRYTGAFVGLIRYIGDSSLLIDQGANAVVVIDPQGRFGRVLAPPKSSDISNLLVPFCECGVDAKGRLIYRSRRLPPFTGGPLIPPEADGTNKPVVTLLPDSAPIIRANFDTRAIDTIAMMRIPVTKSVLISPQAGRYASSLLFNPLPTTDEWALLPDGTIAIVRAQDYHVDWISPDGKLTSSPKMPFDWKPITFDQKQSLLDSAMKAAEARRAAAPPRPPPVPGAFLPVTIPFLTVEPDDMADYYPPIRQGQVRSDPEGNVWILPSTSTLSASGTSGLVWDVVNRSGAIVERVKLPEGRNLASIGPGGTLYLIYAPTPARIVLERATIAR